MMDVLTKFLMLVMMLVIIYQIVPKEMQQKIMKWIEPRPKVKVKVNGQEYELRDGQTLNLDKKETFK